MAVVVGIDVAGSKKGHHGAALALDTRQIVQCWAWQDEHTALAALKALDCLRAVAIDAPPTAHRSGRETRAAERELRRLGLNPQWTRAPGEPAQAWMENGERLWQALQEGLPGVPLIETFPTATVRLGAHRMDALLPLALLGRARHADRRDVLDASVAAWVAAEWLAGRAAVAGEGSADGAIHY